jgi:peptidyl-prolyl cis-trans isomerase SurA
MVTMSCLNIRSLLAWAMMAWTLSAAAQAPATNRSVGRDFIVAVVDSVPITNHDVTLRVPQLRDQLKQQGRSVPEADALLKVALERLIIERALLEFAKDSGVAIEDDAVDQAEQRIAAQNQMSLAAWKQKMSAEGISAARFRQNVRDQLTIQRLTERNVPARIKISDVEIDHSFGDRLGRRCGCRKRPHS